MPPTPFVQREGRRREGKRRGGGRFLLPRKMCRRTSGEEMGRSVEWRRASGTTFLDISPPCFLSHPTCLPPSPPSPTSWPLAVTLRQPAGEACATSPMPLIAGEINVHFPTRNLIFLPHPLRCGDSYSLKIIKRRLLAARRGECSSIR